jgi:hypothetical protein
LPDAEQFPIVKAVEAGIHSAFVSVESEISNNLKSEELSSLFKDTLNAKATIKAATTNILKIAFLMFFMFLIIEKIVSV